MYCFYEYNFRLWGVRGLNVPSSSVDSCANCKTQYFGQLYIMYDGKLHDVNILDQLLPEIGAFYIMDRAYLDFSRLHVMKQIVWSDIYGLLFHSQETIYVAPQFASEHARHIHKQRDIDYVEAELVVAVACSLCAY